MFLYVHFSVSLFFFFSFAQLLHHRNFAYSGPRERKRRKKKKNNFKTSEKMLAGSSSLKELY